MKPELASLPGSGQRRGRKWTTPRIVLGLGGLCLTVGVISCSTINRQVMAPPQIPGATFVGSKECAECHEKITRDFNTASHAKLVFTAQHAVDVGCEGCHGPGSLHVQSGGGARTIINPRKSPESCFQCHLDMRARFNLPSHHPVEEGRVTCSDCHDSHKGPAIIGGGTALAGESETCFKCHAAQRGPHVFEHEALREGCTTCHQPHGSVNAKMLTQRNATLCLKCHFQRQTAAGFAIGNVVHAGFLGNGTCWSGGCHEAVHGSQVSSSLRY